MTNFITGLSALRSSQFALEVVSNNVANAKTEGFHRRRVNLESMPPTTSGGLRIGRGVGVSQVQRIRDLVTEGSLTNAVSDSSHVDQLLSVQRKIEGALLTGDNSIGRKLDQFFAEFTNLSGAPHEPVQRGALLETGQQLAGGLRDAARQLSELKANVRMQVDQELELVNADMQDLSKVSVEISRYAAEGKNHNNELDERDILVNRIAESIGVSRSEQGGNDMHLVIGNHSIHQGASPNVFTVSEVDERLEIRLEGSEQSIGLETGRLAALMETYNSVIPKYEAKLDQLAGTLMQRVNEVQSTGVGDAGAFQSLSGTTAIEDSSLPLAEAFPEADLRAGNLTLALTDSSGERQLHQLAIDPATDTVDDLATQLSAIPGVNASIGAGSGRLQIAVSGDRTFDFAGGFETAPDQSLVTGTSVARVSGEYAGTENENLTVRIEGSGEVGSASNLYAAIYDASGAQQSRVNLGEGYEPGSDVVLDNGVRLQFSTGTLNNGDEWSTPLVTNGDESGVLAALGVNTFFSGSGARDIAVDQRLLDDPLRIATGRTGERSDTSNLARFIALDDAPLMSRDRTLAQFASETVTEIGFEIKSSESLSTSLTNVKLRLEQERDAASGVDLNEELVYLQQYQKSYEAAVRIIQAADDMFNELFAIFR